MRLLQDGNPLSRAAAAAGMSEPTARKYARTGLMPSALKEPRTWRTRPDPYVATKPPAPVLQGRCLTMSKLKRHGTRGYVRK